MPSRFSVMAIVRSRPFAHMTFDFNGIAAGVVFRLAAILALARAMAALTCVNVLATRASRSSLPNLVPGRTVRSRPLPST